MTTNSGIVPSTQLVAECADFLANRAGERILGIQVSPQLGLEVDPQLRLKASADFYSDLDGLSQQLGRDCRFLLVKTGGTSGSAEFGNAFVSYIPNEACVRDKMIYASTKNSLVNALGSGSFAIVMQANSASEVCAEGWRAHVDADSSNVLSASEMSLLEVKQSQLLAKTTKRELASQSNAKLMLNTLPEIVVGGDALEKGDLVSLSIENDDELVLAQLHHNVAVEALGSFLSTSSPGYYVYKNGGGDNFFIYSCPSGSKVRERMIYASNKQPLAQELKAVHGWRFSKVVEVGDAEELDLTDFDSEKSLEPHESVATPARGFAKPRGPRRR